MSCLFPSQGKAKSHLCSFPYSFVATSALEGLCFQLPSSCMATFTVQHLLLPTSATATPQAWVRWHFHCKEPSCSTKYFHHLCICVSEDHIPSTVLVIIYAGESLSNIPNCFFHSCFFHFPFPFLLPLPRMLLVLQGKCIFFLFIYFKWLFHLVAITLSSPEPELGSYRWKKLTGLSGSLRKK